MSSRVGTSRRSVAAVMAATALLLTTMAPAGAQPASDEIRGDLDDVRQRLEELEVEANAVVDRYNEAAGELQALEDEQSATEAEFSELSRQVRARQDAADEHLRRLFKLGPAIELSAVMVTGDPAHTAGRATTLLHILEGERGEMEELAAARTDLDALGERIAEQAEAVRRRTEALEQRRGEVEAAVAGQRDEAEELTAALDAAITREEEEARAAEAARRREAARAAQRERARATSTRTVPSQPAAESEPTDDRPSSEPPEPSSPPPAVRANAQVAVDAALSRLGSPYRWGATGPNAFDCSGLMVWAWAQAGVSLPRTSAAQFSRLRRISRSELRPGDLVFAGSPRVHHVGMYIGNGQIVHSPQTGRTVEIRSMERHDLRGFGRPG